MIASFALFAIDAVLVLAAWPLTGWSACHEVCSQHVWLQALALAGFHLAFLYALGLYRRESLSDTSAALGRIPLVVGMALAAGGIAGAMLGWPLPSALLITAAASLGVCALLARLIFLTLRRHDIFRPSLLVIGAGPRAWDLIWVLRSQGRNLHYDVTFVHEDSFGPIDLRLADDPANRIIISQGNLLAIADEVDADQIVVAPDERRGMALESLITCRTAGYPVYQYMSFLEKEVGRIDIKRPDLNWVLYSEGFNNGPLTRALKRSFDILGSLFILTCCLGMLLPAMLVVFLCDRGPIFYRQERVTLGGRRFNILKLRTMRTDAEKNGAVWAAAKDNRITPIGGFLRRTRLDELPQLINVLKGDMSLVGPRPERPEFIAELAKQLPLYQERHAVKAGLTGWAQINYPYGASLDDARSKLSFDLYYVKKCSLLFDLMIVMQTLRVVIWSGAAGAR
jgi:sugar transferase (PEP-CTERM system associated)